MIMTTQNFMVNVDIDTLANENIVEKIARKLLLNLFSKGNLNAFEIMTGNNNGQVTLEDIKQEMFLFLIEHNQEWQLDRIGGRYSTDEKKYTLVFFNKDIEKQFYRIVSNTIYREKTRHDNKKLWLEIDGEELKIDDISGLASHTCIDDVMTLSLYNQFCNYLLSIKPKNAQLYIDFINTRLQGYRIKEVANILSIKDSKAFDCSKQLKFLWQEFNK